MHGTSIHIIVLFFYLPFYATTCRPHKLILHRCFPLIKKASRFPYFVADKSGPLGLISCELDPSPSLSLLSLRTVWPCWTSMLIKKGLSVNRKISIISTYDVSFHFDNTKNIIQGNILWKIMKKINTWCNSEFKYIPSNSINCIRPKTFIYVWLGNSASINVSLYNSLVCSSDSEI